MTYAALKSRGRGRVAHALEVAGVGVFTDRKGWTPTDSWFTSAGYGAARVYPWLKDVGSIRERIDFLDAKLDVAPLRVVITDVAGGFTALFKDWRLRSYAWLTDDITSTATLIPVDDLTGFSTSEVGWIDGSECVFWTSTTGDNELALVGDDAARGYLGTVQRPFSADLSADPPQEPMVADGPDTLVGKRAVLYAAEVNDDGTVSATEVLYRGRVASGIETGDGEWGLPIEHVWTAAQGLKIGNALPTARLEPNQYYYYGSSSPTYRSGFVAVRGSDATYVQVEKYIYTSLYYDREGGTKPYHFRGHEELAQVLNNAMYDIEDDSEGSWLPQINLSGERYTLRWDGPDASSFGHVFIREGDPLWALGFAAGYVYWNATAEEVIHEADDPPRLLVVETDSAWTGEYPLLYYNVADEDNLLDEAFVTIPGFPYTQINEVSSGKVYFKPDGRGWDRTRTERFFAVDHDEEDRLYLKHCICNVGTTGGLYYHDTLAEALQRYLYMLADQPEGHLWLGQDVIRYDDIDWAELNAAITDLPPGLNRWNDCITEPVRMWDVLGPMFGLLGIAPRITTDGKVGFVRMETPTAAQAHSVELDGDIWSALDAADVRARLDSEPLVNMVRVDHSRDYRDGKWSAEPISVRWAEGWNHLAKTRSVGYKVRTNFGAAPLLLAETLSQELDATHFGVFGRLSPSIEIPCTWTAKQYRCGDIVKLTHCMVPDLTGGDIGVDGRLAVVVGRTWRLRSRGVDSLTVRIPPEQNAGAIAPCALGTSYTSSSGTLTCATADTPLYAPSGGNDLDAFDQTTPYEALVIARGSAYAEYSTSVTSVDTAAKTVGLSSDVITTWPTAGVWLTLPRWSSTCSWQQDYAFMASTATRPVLHGSTTTSDPKEWTI